MILFPQRFGIERQGSIERGLTGPFINNCFE
jgi:hypothetical protein